MIEVKQLTQHPQFVEAVQLQQKIWGFDDIELLPKGGHMRFRGLLREDSISAPSVEVAHDTSQSKSLVKDGYRRPTLTSHAGDVCAEIQGVHNA